MGFPRQGLMLRAQDAFQIPFSLMWCGFAVFWEYSVVNSSRAPAFFELWGVPFVCFGLYFVFGRFIVDAGVRARTIYAVSNQRILILSGWWKRSTRSMDLLNLGEINLSEDANGRGTITFGPPNPYNYWGRGWPGGGRVASPAFERILDARQVVKTIRDAQKAARERPS
jgi:hypothetical protein